MYEDSFFEEDKPGGNVWFWFHILSLILALGKLFGGFETLPWWFIFIPFIADLVLIICFLLMVLGLFILTSQFGRK